MISFDSLLKTKNLSYLDRWHPSEVSEYEKILESGILKDAKPGLLKNICYHLQYLEYITYQLKELKLHNIIELMLYKNCIIVAMSIIEAIFYSVIKINNLYNISNKECIGTFKSNETKINEHKFIVESNLYKIVEPKEKEMTFDSMIKKIESKKLLNLKHEIFPYIKKYRNSRNRVHLQIATTKGESDYWNYEKKDYYIVRFILYFILTDDIILNEKEKQKSIKKYNFIKPNASEYEEFKKARKWNETKL